MELFYGVISAHDEHVSDPVLLELSPVDNEPSTKDLFKKEFIVRGMHQIIFEREGIRLTKLVLDNPQEEKSVRTIELPITSQGQLSEIGWSPVVRSTKDQALDDYIEYLEVLSSTPRNLYVALSPPELLALDSLITKLSQGLSEVLDSEECSFILLCKEINMEDPTDYGYMVLISHKSSGSNFISDTLIINQDFSNLEEIILRATNVWGVYCDHITHSTEEVLND